MPTTLSEYVSTSHLLVNDFQFIKLKNRLCLNKIIIISFRLTKNSGFKFISKNTWVLNFEIEFCLSKLKNVDFNKNFNQSFCIYPILGFVQKVKKLETNIVFGALILWFLLLDWILCNISTLAVVPILTFKLHNLRTWLSDYNITPQPTHTGKTIFGNLTQEKLWLNNPFSSTYSYSSFYFIK